LNSLIFISDETTARVRDAIALGENNWHVHLDQREPHARFSASATRSAKRRPGVHCEEMAADRQSVTIENGPIDAI
jgi:hypothetical protein